MSSILNFKNSMGNLVIKYSELQAKLPTNVSYHCCLTPQISQLCQVVLSFPFRKQANPSIILFLKERREEKSPHIFFLWSVIVKQKLFRIILIIIILTVYFTFIFFIISNHLILITILNNRYYNYT